MMSKGLKDPYAKLISPDEFSTMQKYDMTGVGLNIGSSEEFYQKVVRPSDSVPCGSYRCCGVLSPARFRGRRNVRRMAFS